RPNRYQPSLFLHFSRPPRSLLSFPTRRSSDLQGAGPGDPGPSPHRQSRERAAGPHGRGDRALYPGDDARAHRRGTRGISRIERTDRKSTRLNSSHSQISYAVFCLKKKKIRNTHYPIHYNYLIHTQYKFILLLTYTHFYILNFSIHYTSNSTYYTLTVTVLYYRALV